MKIEKKYTLLIIICCIAPVIFMFIYGNFIAPTKKEGFVKSKFEGIIIGKFRDQKNHNSRTIRIKEDRKESITEFVVIEDTLFYNYVIIGDSIIKKELEDYLTVRRHNDVKKFSIFLN